jgi:NAD(P)-dependent dehydrogenase (short-subunit alcohol dehydrogenase family)
MSNRIVVITGATGGLGEAVVERFEAAGDRVIGVSRNVPEGKGWVAANLLNSKQASEAMMEIARREGRIDVLVHVLGGFAGGKPVDDTDDETWDRMMLMNASSAFYVLKGVVGSMRAQGRGRVIAIGSRAGVAHGANLAAYNASKAALNALVQTLASEMREHGITANVILPSTIDTDANRKWAKPEDIEKFVKPSAIADLCFYLASDAAQDISGALVPIYGRA